MEKRKRKAINACFLCSSENYELHHKAHIVDLQINHELHKEIFDKAEKLPYTLCFGKYILVPKEKVNEFKQQNITIIYK